MFIFYTDTEFLYLWVLPIVANFEHVTSVENIFGSEETLRGVWQFTLEATLGFLLIESLSHPTKITATHKKHDMTFLKPLKCITRG